MSKKSIKNILIFSLFLMILVVPVLANAAIIPCGGHILNEDGTIKGPQPPCDFNMLMKLVNKIIDWIIMISVPIAAGVFAWAGINMMIHADNPGKRSESISMMKKVFIGFVFILAAWIIVGTITKALLRNPEVVPIDLSINKSINLYI